MQLLVDKLHRFWSGAVLPGQNTPLLDSAEFQKIRELATNFPYDLIKSDKEQAQPLIGDALSVFYGQGLEFEENRLYSPGDDPRFINWRLMARTGELYSKVFRESRRPQVFIVVDRRAGMHFGTRRQLKVTQAVRLAAFYLYMGLQKQFAVGGLVLEEQLEWYRSGTDEHQLQAFLQHVSRQSHPVPFHRQQASLKDALQQVQLHLGAGNILILLGDFHDLDKECETSLYSLACMHEVIACHIYDPAEMQLPDSGRLSFLDESSGELCDLDSTNQIVKAAFSESCRKQHEQIRNRLQQTGCFLNLASTEQDILEVLTPEIYA